jgi:hypothetical protein
MKEKLKKIHEFLSEQGVELPVDVKNALEDVFNENDSVENVDVYFKEDADLFGEDITLVNEVKAYLDKPSSGKSNNVFTYYGEVEYSLSEFVRLYRGEEVLEEVTNVDQLDRSSSVNPAMFAIVLIEAVEWVDGKLIKRPHLYIYCPQESKDSKQEKED